MTRNDKNEDQEKTTNQLSQNLQRMSGTYTDNYCNINGAIWSVFEHDASRTIL